VFTITLKDNLSQLTHKILFDKFVVKIAFFCIDEESSDCFKEVVKDFYEVEILLLLFVNHLVEYFEEKLNVARRYFEGTYWAFDAEK